MSASQARLTATQERWELTCNNNYYACAVLSSRCVFPDGVVSSQPLPASLLGGGPQTHQLGPGLMPQAGGSPAQMNFNHHPAVQGGVTTGMPGDTRQGASSNQSSGVEVPPVQLVTPDLLLCLPSVYPGGAAGVRPHPYMQQPSYQGVGNSTSTYPVPIPQ